MTVKEDFPVGTEVAREGNQYFYNSSEKVAKVSGYHASVPDAVEVEYKGMYGTMSWFYYGYQLKSLQPPLWEKEVLDSVLTKV